MKGLFTKSFVVAALMSFGITAAAHAGQVRRFADVYINAEQTASTTPDDSGNPTPIYQGTVKVPADTNVLEITVSATGDLADVTNSLWLNCQVDGNNCNSGANSAANSVPGWVPVLSLDSSAQIPTPTVPTSPATGTDNNIHYTWCVQIKPNRHAPHSLHHQIQLNMASGTGDPVYIEQLQVSVTGARIGGFNKANACSSPIAPSPVS